MKPMLSVIANIQVIAFNILTAVAEKCKRGIVPTYGFWLFLAITPVAATATTAITVIGPGSRITIGSDSLFVYTGGGRSLGCKTQHEGEIFFVTVKLRNKPETGFNSVEIARESCKRIKRNITEIANDFLERVQTPLKKALEFSRIHTPDTYLNNYLGKLVLETTFAEIIDSNPHVAVVSFSLDQLGQLTHVETQLPDAFNDDTFFSGEHAQITAVASQVRHEFPGNVQFIERLIQIEAIAHPDKVGGPIGIVEIGPKGHHWPRIGSCEKEQ